jgi:membrane protein
MKLRVPNPLLLGALAVGGFLIEPLEKRAARLKAKSAAAEATSPARRQAKGLWHTAKQVATGFSQDRVMAEAAGVTFYVLLALFPAIATLISIYGLFADAGQLSAKLHDLDGVVPDGGIGIIQAQITALTSSPPKALGFGALLGLATSLWSANAGVKAFFDALNVVYHEQEKRGFVKLTLITVTFTIGLIAFILLALGAVVVVPIALNYVGLGSDAAVLLNLLRWPVLTAVLAVALSLLYRFGPSQPRAKLRWVSWGSAFAAVGWLLASLGFSYYVANFGSYNKTYGSLGAVVGFMTWIWVSAMVVLLGAEVNAELERQALPAEKPSR